MVASSDLLIKETLLELTRLISEKIPPKGQFLIDLFKSDGAREQPARLIITVLRLFPSGIDRVQSGKSLDTTDETINLLNVLNLNIKVLNDTLLKINQHKIIDHNEELNRQAKEKTDMLTRLYEQGRHTKIIPVSNK